MNTRKKPQRLFKVGEVADQADVCIRTVYRWIDRGELKVHRFGRTVRVSEEDLASFLNRNRC